MKVPKEWTAAAEARAPINAAAAKPLRGAQSVTAAIDEMSFGTLAKSPAAKTPQTAVTARIDMSAEVAGAGLCPECKQPMQRCVTNGIASYACHPDRIVIPVPDSILESEAVIETGELNLEAAFGPSTCMPGV